MTSLGGEDGTGNGDVGGLGDGGSGAEVGRDTDVLNERSGGEERLGVGDTGELVGARLGGGGSERTREERNVLGLVLGDLLETVSDPLGVTGLLEGLLVPLA